MIGSSKNNTVNYPKKCFWTQEKETKVKCNPGLSAIRPSHNWALGSASDWSCRVGNLLQPISSTTQIWVVTRHQYGISALVSQPSFGGKTSGSVSKCRLFSQALSWLYRCYYHNAWQVLTVHPNGQRTITTSGTRRELEPRCVPQWFLGSLLGKRRSPIGPEIFAKVNSAHFLSRF